MNLEEKKFLTDSIGKEADILKSQIDLIHKKMILFLGLGAGSWIYAIDFYKSDNILSNIITVILSISFIFSGFGNLISMIKLSKLEKKLKKLEEEIKNVR
jgi:uncharacterized membrane protein YciS (DUF1049 family)